MEKKEEEIKYVFSSLVESQDDVRGHIAYALYKYKKIDRIKNVHKGSPMTPAQKELFRKENTTQKSIDDYLEQAENILKDYVNEQLKVAIEQAELNIERNFEKNEIKKLVDKQKKWNWIAVMESMVASAILPIAIILLLVVIAMICHVDFGTVIKEIGKAIVKSMQ